ncbi:MAG TPA: carboxylating nicotinate-nucleotide diphosphorylase [Acidimicrobiales bacterium]|nr:carboxylating nicotinate-nucleotide diphosphorylase [Acidimicrobiales bacterium]
MSAPWGEHLGTGDAGGLLDAWPSSGPPDPPAAAVREAVARALAEDVGPLGDLTAMLVPDTQRGRAHVVARADGVAAGRLCALETFAQVDPALAVDWRVPDGGWLAPGSVLAEVSGPMRSILTAERTALNFLCHLSGIATLTRGFVDAVAQANPATRVLDTRKTTPGLRALEKAAVRAGGGWNHRAGLSDAVLVKDNHLGSLAIAEAVALARRWWPGRMVEVECDEIEQVVEAVEAGATAVLLDNMTPSQVSQCVALVRARTADAPGRVLVEASGGVTIDNAPAFAAAGADLISVGALTHSAPVLDLGLDLVED